VPTKESFGSTLLKAAFEKKRMEYAPEGFPCEVNVRYWPLADISSAPHMSASRGKADKLDQTHCHISVSYLICLKLTFVVVLRVGQVVRNRPQS
jgi:hypothetical protein